MIFNHHTLKFLTAALLLASTSVSGDILTKETRQQMGHLFDRIVSREASIGHVHIDTAYVKEDTLKLFATENLSYAPLRENSVKEIYDGIHTLLPSELQSKKLVIYTNERAIENYIPMVLRDKQDKKQLRFKTPDATPLVKDVSSPYTVKNGLADRHIAMWQSHGFYYEGKLDRWEWQRARLFQTVEDLYTQSYVLPFLVPMLENAGAYVMMPRERDANPFEVIVDNDGATQAKDKVDMENATYASQLSSTYTEHNGSSSWEKGSDTGFGYKRATYLNHNNPFKEGTFRQTRTIKKGDAALATWTPDIPVAGDYAVYVSYKTLQESTDDAAYTVVHRGQRTLFHVNQQMGGGTWIYLGSFGFDKGKSEDNRVELSNLSKKNGRIVTADAVKIGGGMGNVARYINLDKPEDDQTPITMADHPQKSGYPRFCEAARYWMQWAGVPDSIYDLNNSKNDYTDDYKNRGLWVNWLAGGSSVDSTDRGLHIPMDLSFAFHSDAGTTLNNDIIGTLAIYDSEHYGGKFQNGAPRTINHDLADLVQSSIVKDLRLQCEPNWTRRGMWDKPYFEAWMPKVPAMLLELLSHENFADMRYGLDPRFRFITSRAIYKGILKFITSQRGEKYVVQPLPVHHMMMRMTDDTHLELSWQPTTDSLEPTAEADRYLVFTRIGDGDWDNGQIVKKPIFKTTLTIGKVCSYKVLAANDGGVSFPSEILSAGLANQAGNLKPILVVNGFHRISAPADFVAPAPADTSLAGFLDGVDHGVPYLKDISYIGSMKEFRRRIPWMDDDASGFGDSYGDHEKQVIAGNTFDYPAVHGKAMLQAGHSFISCSDEAVEDSSLRLADYPIVDLILGKECQTKMGRGGVTPLQFKTFTVPMQQRITAYLNQGGNIFVSGQFVGSDIWDSRVAAPKQEDKDFATGVLKYKWRVGQAATGGGIKTARSPLMDFSAHYDYYNELNSDCYVVESPDAIEPATKDAWTVMRYAQNNLSAAVAYKGNYRTYVMGVPFETICSPDDRAQLMKQILDFFQK